MSLSGSRRSARFSITVSVLIGSTSWLSAPPNWAGQPIACR
jgi:hypothetical protein